MSVPPPSGGGGDGRKPPKPPQRTVIAPLPGARARPAPGPGDGDARPDQGQEQRGARPLPWAGGSGAAWEKPAPDPGVGSAPPADAWGTPPATPSPAASGGGQHAWMGSAGKEQFFPEIARPTEAGPAAARHKIPLEKALESTVTGHAVGANPFTAAAAGLLMLLGRLRSQVVDMQALPLMAHVTREIDGFEARATGRGADPHQALVAKYVLCGTADDVVQNLPGTDREVWVQYAMEARFFNRRTSGVGIFQEIEKALADPARCYDLLELMLICLQLGFEGKYRGAPGGDVDLQRIRRQIYETLRHLRRREDDDISPHWQGFAIATPHQGRRVPLWVVTSLAMALLCGSFIGMRVYLGQDAGRVADGLRGLHPDGTLTLARAATLPDLPPEPEPYVPPVFEAPGQLERIRAALAPEIEAGDLTVETRGNFIAVTANNLVLFDSGRADLREDFLPVARRIAEVLETEPGAIRIVGHTDNVPMSGRGRFRNNQELSVARAEAVAGVIRPALSEAERVEVIGAGEDDPVADNATAEGRAQNRRVEVLIRREEASGI